eukprot:TRINITY_DN107121_c0_g1_i1.p1 TRINITY_DN107121_c0_g1~~TRINITY_DN107121_c0_g1_i1.p1  ORF type:complete len:397 (+),score=73.74 TRINITY_DN107121_c0_g1_i1:52-1242(+)
MADCFASESSGDESLAVSLAEELKTAVKAGDVDHVEELLNRKANLHQRYKNGITPLHLAVVHEHLELVRFLIAAGADPGLRTTDEDHLSALQIASETSKEIFWALGDDPPPKNPRLRRFLGPLCLFLLVAANAFVFFLLAGPGARLESNSWIRQIVSTLAVVCLSCLVLVNVLDAGTVFPEDVAHIENLRQTSDRVQVVPAMKAFEDESFLLLPESSEDDDGEQEPYRWCRSCKFWRPPGVSHCAECRRCYWRMDHHCWAIGNCVAQRNHRFFSVMVTAGAAAWAIAAVSILLGLFEHLSVDEWWPPEEEKWELYLGMLFLLWSGLLLTVLIPFACFHMTALFFNITSKSECGARSSVAAKRRLNGIREFKDIFCGPLSFRTCEATEEGNIRTLQG